MFERFKALVVATFRDPDTVARQLIAARLPVLALWMALALVVIAGVLIAALSGALTPPVEGARVVTPFQFAVSMGMALVGAIGAMHVVGRILGGQGAFADMLVCMTWVQVVLVLLQVVLDVVLMVMPGLFVPVTVLAYVVGLWLMARFVRVVHGFDTMGGSIMTVIGGFMALGFVLFLMITLVGGATGL